MSDLTVLAERFDLTAEERDGLRKFDELFLQTQAHTNLIARSTIDDRWDRHVADSLQLWPLLPRGAATLLDIGSGGGFPALPLAILAASRRSDLRLTLCESIVKKAAFLREAAATIGLANVEVRPVRVETLTQRFDVVTARAVAPLTRLLPLVVPRLSQGGVLIAPKGRNAESELEAARRDWRLDAKRVTSATDPEATILILSNLESRS